MEPLEIEVKYYLKESRSVRERIVAHGGLSSGRALEVNYRYDDADGSLRKRGELLRLRQDTSARLTFKARPPVTYEGFKTHIEYEVGVGDFGTMNQIIEKLGFSRAQIYEKWRETFHLGECELCLDSMPFGDFLEIEGERDEITRVADLLGLCPEERITANYLQLFDTIREKAGLDFQDLTFENFKGVHVDFADYLERFTCKKS